MCDNDSLNDSSELFNLYSSQKVTDIYKTQLQELLGNKNSIYGETKSIELESIEPNQLNNGANTGIINKNGCNLTPCDIKLASQKEKELSNSIESNIEILEVTDCFVDDSVEIVDEINIPGVRRSLRIKNKQKKSKHKTVTNSKSITKCKKKTRRKKSQLDPEEVVLEESIIESNNDLEDELNPEVSVKIIWKSVEIKKFKIRKFQKMSKIYNDLSQEENVPVTQIILTFKNIKVHQNDTPGSLNLQIYDFLEGGILSEAISLEKEIEPLETHNKNDDNIALKFQDSNKKLIKIFLNKSDKMKVGMIKYSEQTETPLENIKFFFDGELLDPCETAQTLGLDDDEIIDVKIIK